MVQRCRRERSRRVDDGSLAPKHSYYFGVKRHVFHRDINDKLFYLIREMTWYIVKPQDESNERK
ncbi:Signal transduction histidine kinase [Sesbania bispinosa]|nr:Signal transduction histidine kinase [Sesbania bispinosa]